jgi:hypothetical protein
MKIYTGTVAGEKIDKVEKYGLGIMISPSPTFEPRKQWLWEDMKDGRKRKRQIFFAFDNGAYQSYTRGYPFMERYFWEALEKCYAIGIDMDFIVCPDIVAKGLYSLEYSWKWTDKLITVQHLALALQDGMEPKDITNDILDRFSHLFLGGTVHWKWETLDQWCEFAKDKKKPLHVAKIGTSTKLTSCKSKGVSSVDSTNIARNGSWSVIEIYKRQQLF